MKPIHLAVRLLACSLPLLPAAPILMHAVPAQAQPLPERRLISGRITRGDGAGVAKATITIQREQQDGAFAFWGASTVTDSSGAFSFPEAEDGAYFISIEAEGYAPLQNKPLRVTENSTVFNTRLDRLATLVLRLLGPDGAPVKDARAVVRLTRPEGAGEPLRRRTNGAGVLQVLSQSPGAYSLEVSVPGAGFASLRGVAIQFADTLRPVDVPLQKGGNLKISARDANEAGKSLGGATLALSATLPPDEAERKAGRLGTKSLANLQKIYAYSLDGSGAVTREGDGTLELRDLPPGRYRAKLSLLAYAPSETREVEVKAGEDSVAEFALSAQVRSSSLKVRVLDKDNAPIAGRDWTLQLRPLGPLAPGVPDVPGGEAAPEVIGGEAIAEAGGFGILYRRARSDNKGEFTLLPIRAGRWRVLAFPSREDGERTVVSQRDVAVSEDGGEVTLNFRGELK